MELFCVCYVQPAGGVYDFIRLQVDTLSLELSGLNSELRFWSFVIAGREDRQLDFRTFTGQGS
jgi:hypothetical protein